MLLKGVRSLYAVAKLLAGYERLLVVCIQFGKPYKSEACVSILKVDEGHVVLTRVP